MRIEETGLSPWLVEALRTRGVETLYPPQAESLKRGLLEGRNLVVSSPTASGKTLIAIMAAERVLAAGKKVLYLTPLRALTSEKAEEFRSIFGEMGPGYRVIAVSGDYDDPGEWIGSRDVVVATYEKADSLVRHRARWLSSVGLVVVDEIHMLGDRERGPTLEMTIAKLLETIETPQILGLSATIPNVKEIAEWLEASPIVSDFRPVPLKEGVGRGGRIVFSDGSTWRLRSSGDLLSAVVGEGLMDGGQVLVFALTRRKAEKLAEGLTGVVRASGALKGSDLEVLREYALRIRESERESPFAERLAQLVEQGSSFHHAGLGHLHRTLIVEAFKERVLPLICATPTLAAGVNLPARMVVIPELRRFSSRLGSSTLSVTEYKQFCGRAGRPMYDEVGYPILLANSKAEEEYLLERYIRGEPERVYSALGNERHLRSHILSLIASGLASSELGLRRIINRTFYVQVFGAKSLDRSIALSLEMLEHYLMISREDGLQATRLGHRVSELYIDPLTAVRIVKMTEGLESLSPLAALQIICSTPDMSDVYAARLRLSSLRRLVEEIGEEMLLRPPSREEDPEEYELYLEGLKNALVLWSWVEEVPEKEIYERFIVEPGDFAALRERAEWISYSASNVLELVGRKSVSRLYSVLTERLRHGVREELLPLVKLPDIGRVRGRNLWREGIRSVEDVRQASLEQLARVPGIGQTIAAKIKRAVEEL
jgi:helicase